MTDGDEVDFREIATEKYGDKVSQLEEEQFERLEELFQEKLDKFGQERLALTSAIGSFNFEQSSGGEEVTVYTVGVDGPRNFQGQTLFCHGVIDPEDDQPGRVVIIVPEGSVDTDLAEIKEMWDEPFQPLNANISFRPAKGIKGAYVGEVGSMGSIFSVKDDDKRDFDERKEFVESHVPTAQIATISEEMTKTKDSGWPAAFGADFKRLNMATILESAVSGKGARYVLQDDSFIEATDLPPEVRGEDQELGLVGYGDPEIMALDQESIVDVFGTITPNQDGQPTMDITGYHGHYVQEATINRSSSSDSGGSGSSGSGGSNVSGQAAEERTI